MHKSNKQWMISLMAFIILVLTTYFVFKDSFPKILKTLAHIPLYGIGILIAMGLFVQMMDGTIFYILGRKQSLSFKWRDGVKTAFFGIFGNVATCAVGTMPLQTLVMSRAGIPVGGAVGIVLLTYVMDKTAVILCGLLSLLFFGKWIGLQNLELDGYIAWGIGLCFFASIFMMLLCMSRGLQNWTVSLIRKLPNTPKWQNRKEKILKNLNSLSGAFQEYMHTKSVMGLVFILNWIKLAVFFSIPFVCFYLEGITSLSWIHSAALASLMCLISNALPNVAGMGPAEFAFYLMFYRFMDTAHVTSAMILYRSATFFIPFLASLPVVWISRSDWTKKDLANEGKAGDS